MPNSQAVSGKLQRARELFEAVSAEHGASREAVLNRGSKGDPELRALVEQLIRADDEPHPVLDRPLSLSAVLDSPALEPGTRIGAYRILREIGSGGMGTVYLAELADGPAPELYAIKVMRWSSPELARRFQQEQEILRSLQHPNIARLIASGVTGDQSPYLVMEYADGRPIHRYCDENGLLVDARLGLFRQVCAAVRYLHQNLVVHRDLKPSNILVTAEGTVKLVDFGIAKLVQSSAGVSLETSMVLMTPDYASPEQIRGGPISTLTDVYSLGVLLYELLTGVKPFSEPQAAVHETMRRICEEPPAKPSASVSRGSWERGVRRRLARKLRGELDNLVLKSIRKEPERRYVSVEQFDEDVRCYLAGLPVLAQGDSFLYQAGKFAARNKAGVAAGIAMLVLLTGGIVATSIEAGIAREQRVRAEAKASEAERRTKEADRERVRAEQQTSEAQLQRANAERRLEQLQKLAQSAVKTYTSTASGSNPEAAAARIAENARDSLLALRSEGLLETQLTGLLDQTAAAADSYELANDQSWHVPAGWSAQETESREYRVGLDRRLLHQGKPSLFIRSLVPEPEGTVDVLQTFRANRYRGKRVRLSGFLRTEKVATQASLFVRIGADDPVLRSYDRVGASGTGPWKLYELVADVPSGADSIQFGISMDGTGTLWAAHFRFEAVSSSVPLTAPNKPRNLNFTQPQNTN